MSHWGAKLPKYWQSGGLTTQAVSFHCPLLTLDYLPKIQKLFEGMWLTVTSNQLSYLPFNFIINLKTFPPISQNKPGYPILSICCWIIWELEIESIFQYFWLWFMSSHSGSLCNDPPSKPQTRNVSCPPERQKGLIIPIYFTF